MPGEESLQEGFTELESGERMSRIRVGRKRGGVIRHEHQPPGVLWVPLPRPRVGDIAGITGELVQLPERLAYRSLTGGLLSECGRSAWFVPQLPFSPSQGYSSEFLSEYIVFL